MKIGNKRWIKPIKYLFVALFWIALWQTVAMAVGEELLFPSPMATLRAFWDLCKTSNFWLTVAISFKRILIGILISMAMGILGGILTGIVPFFRILFEPILSIIRSTPVASFIVLLVLWMSRDSVPTVISVLMVLPVVWSNVQEGILRTDRELLEMAKVFRLPFYKKIVGIYLPSVAPYLASAARSSLGMAWKAGIAAEVIVLPLCSIGRQLYYASNNLETARMFAWTATVILLSMLVDCLMSRLLRRWETGSKAAVKGGESA
ncbi:MAG: ABC transporter permease [Eubacteriales bacterium]